MEESGGVDGELAYELAVDEHVAGLSGDDDGGGLMVVFGADGDPVAAPGCTGAVDDFDSVDAGGSVEGMVVGSALGFGLPDVGWDAPVEAAVGSGMVVDDEELVELFLKFEYGAG